MYNKQKKIIIDCIFLFTNLISDKQISIDHFFSLISEFIKKINNIKKKIDYNVIKNNIYNLDINLFIDNNEINKIVDNIFIF